MQLAQPPISPKKRAVRASFNNCDQIKLSLSKTFNKFFLNLMGIFFKKISTLLNKFNTELNLYKNKGRDYIAPSALNLD